MLDWHSEISRHAMELAFVFGALDNTEFWQSLAVTAAGAKSRIPVISNADRRISEIMMKIWTGFARTGDPNSKGLLSWPAWDKDTDRYLYIADPLEVRSSYSKIAQNK